jgi:hypothetical protein
MLLTTGMAASKLTQPTVFLSKFKAYAGSANKPDLQVSWAPYMFIHDRDDCFASFFLKVHKIFQVSVKSTNKPCLQKIDLL